VKGPCRICLKPGGDCKACVQSLFATDVIPSIDIELNNLHLVALESLGQTSLSGVQKKLSVNLQADRATLKIAVGTSPYVLKPQTEVFPQLPENEHLTMRLASEFGLDVPACGIVNLKDGSPAYIIRRFDRLDDNSKLAAEDFCQLSEKSPKEKYQGSAEGCAKIVSRFCDEPAIEKLKLFRHFVFSWWVGNGDLHLKNIAILTEHNEHTHLSPCYDLLSTRLVIPDDQFALTVGGKRNGLTRKAWLNFAENAGIPEKAANRVLARPAECLDSALKLVQSSMLNDDLKERYAQQLQDTVIE
jgi:serine/threonine-protein kinase HipA